MERIEISLSKVKMILFSLLALLFVVGGYYMVCSPDIGNSQKYSPGFIKFWGIISIFFFGFGFLYLLWKIFDPRPGLIIDKIGITDNSSGIAVGLVEWKDVKSIKAMKINSHKYVLVDVVNPQKYLKRQNRLKASMIKLNMRMCGTPVIISATSLKSDFLELEKILIKALEKHKVENN